jgi:hypothetical protein
MNSRFLTNKMQNPDSLALLIPDNPTRGLGVCNAHHGEIILRGFWQKCDKRFSDTSVQSL